MEKIKIFIAGDDPLLRIGLRIEFEQAGRFRVVGEARNGRDAASGIRASHPDLSLIDLALPGPSAIENVKYLRKTFPAMKIIMLTTFGDEAMAGAAVAAGADGYIMRSVENRRIVRIIGRRVVKSRVAPLPLRDSEGQYAFV